MSVTFDELFTSAHVVAVLRGHSPARSVSLAIEAWDAGVEVVEVTVQTDIAMKALVAVVAAAEDRGRHVGAGTVTDEATARAAIDAGAAFTVSPVLDEALLRAHSVWSVPHLPGVATPGELALAWRFGCRWVKVFPAASLGPDWFSAIRGPFPDMGLIATGGITLAEAHRYLDAGADVVGLGSGVGTPEARDAVEALVAYARSRERTRDITAFRASVDDRPTATVGRSPSRGVDVGR